MADVNLLTYLLYSLLTLAGRKAPSTDPSLQAWEAHSEPSVSRARNQQPFDYIVKHNEESCPPQEEYSDCDAGCQETCENIGQPVICPRMCVPGCVCQEPGTVRGPDGNCIPPPLCPSAVEPPVTGSAEEDRDDFTRYDYGRTEEAYQWPMHWGDNEDKTQDPSDQYPVTSDYVTLYKYSRTEDADQWPYLPTNYEDKTQDPSDQYPVTRGPTVESLAEQDPDEARRRRRKPLRPSAEWKSYDSLSVAKVDPDEVEPYTDFPRVDPDEVEPYTDFPRVDPDEIYNAEQNPKIPGECPKLEIISCEKFCERNCDNMEQKVIPCPKFCIRGCICKQGYVRGPDGRCIEPKKCPKHSRVSHQEPQPEIDRRCPPNKIYRKCETLEICTEECVCKPGFVEGRHGSCIKPQSYLLSNDEQELQFDINRDINHGCQDIDACLDYCDPKMGICEFNICLCI